MIQVGEIEAKAQFPSLLKKVREGEEVLITQRGKAVARLVPAGRRPTPAEIDKSIEEFLVFRKGIKLGGLDWKALRDEGRR